ncbi:MAG: hypothetical protein VX834_03480 [Myxococcota bacterium]|nr:hypothetical protein [Myxococcota bacterium]
MVSREFKRAWFVALFVAGALLCASNAGAAKKKDFTVSPKVYKKIAATHELIQAEKYGEALKSAKSALNSRRLNEHEQALLWQTLGFIYSAQENFKQAAESFEACIALEALPEMTMRNTEYNLAQVYMLSEEYRSVIRLLDAWVTKVEKVTADAWILLAGANAQINNWKKAVEHGEKALAATRKPKEQWLTMMLSLYYELRRLPKVASTLETLVVRYPKKSYWLQLVSIYNELNQEARALAAMDLAYAQGYVTTEKELLQYVRFCFAQELPLKAAKLLTSGLDSGQLSPTEENLKFLANAWIQAREPQQALEPLQKAAQLGKTGELFMHLGQTYSELLQWKQASVALNQALNKGGLERPGDAWILLAIAEISSKKYGKARQALARARQDERVKKAAEQWLSHLSELERRR